ncbi:MAG: glycoside hydrolase family 127 protein, partial [Candidatus Aminicenantes bacterium]|nr:glycoside hydrolase family 127 protein [Candidatus Aminicenantes bacterium]
MSQSEVSIQPVKLKPMPLGSIKPTGWLKNQLRIQADGLSGHLDEFWPDISDSAWFGGKSDAWERAPYWLDGVVPLAFLLEDENLIARVTKYMNQIIAHQDESGWISPAEDQSKYDLWAIFLVLKPLIQYHEATGDERIPDVVEKTLRWVDGHIDRRPLFNWGKFRWFESLLSIYWLYERTQEDWLLELAVKLQAQGFDWESFFRRFPLTGITPKGKWTFMGHVVNNGMAVKAPALWWRLTGDENDKHMVYEMIEKQDLYHGQAAGIFSGDECFAGKNPSQGTELCAVVEYQFSLEILLSILG